MSCKHENKKLVDWTYGNGMHDSTHKCLDCGVEIFSYDCPIMYKYPPEKVRIKGVLMNKEDAEIILAKEEEIKRGKL